MPSRELSFPAFREPGPRLEVMNDIARHKEQGDVL